MPKYGLNELRYPVAKEIVVAMVTVLLIQLICIFCKIFIMIVHLHNFGHKDYPSNLLNLSS